MGGLAPPNNLIKDLHTMVMQYMIQTSEHYNERINEVEAQVMDIRESIEVLKYNIKELSDVLNHELDRIANILKEASN